MERATDQAPPSSDASDRNEDRDPQFEERRDLVKESTAALRDFGLEVSPAEPDVLDRLAASIRRIAVAAEFARRHLVRAPASLRRADVRAVLDAALRHGIAHLIEMVDLTD